MAKARTRATARAADKQRAKTAIDDGRKQPKKSTPVPGFKIPEQVLAYARGKDRRGKQQVAADLVAAFAPPAHPPGVVPAGASTIAQDSALVAAGSACAWAASGLGGMAFGEGWAFLGYTYLAQLAQLPEYRCISETIATEMTRKWIELQGTGDDDKTERIKQLNDELERLQVQDAFREIAEQDGFFGRAHLYLDLGTTDDRDELKKPIGDGRNSISKAKVGRGDLKRIKTVEAVWCYPANYNSNDPLKPNWYRAESWYAQGKELHASRLLTFVGREVPDLLKPAYSFGGLSLSQMAKPYVDNWLRTRQSVADLIHAFSVFVLSSDLSTLMQADGSQFIARLQMFNMLRDNKGLMAVNKDTETLENVSAPLGTLDALQAQTQEHMAAVSRIPIVKLLGIQPAGLNASSEGELRTFYDMIHAYQSRFFTANLRRVIGFAQLSLWGEVDPDITFVYEPLWSLDEKGEAEVRKIDADTGQILVDSGVISPEEERKRVAGDPGTPYQGLDVNVMPELREEEEEGLAPRGAGGAISAELDDGERKAA